MVLTDFVRNQDTKFYIGYSYIVSTGIMIFVNLGRVLLNIVLQIKDTKRKNELQKNFRTKQGIDFLEG